MPSALLDEEYQTPIAKRQKLSNAAGYSGDIKVQASRIFAPFRTIGLVSPTEVPFTSVPLGKTTFQVTTSVGRCLQTYDLRKGLNLVFLSRPQTPELITATAAWKDRVFAAWGGTRTGSLANVWVFKRGRMVGELERPGGLLEPVKQIMVVGSWIVGCCSTRIEVWRSENYEHYMTLTPLASRTASSEGVLTGLICNMPTFLNKIFAARQDGSIEIWNISTGKLIYTILPISSDAGSVCALQPTPALSLIAISYSNGQLVIHDIKTDKTIMELNTTSGQEPISTISFRTDGCGAGEDGRRPGVMATASLSTGDVTFWDLNEGGRVMGVLRGAHNPPSRVQDVVGGGVTKVEFLHGQPVLLTTGLDNSLKSWIFDETPFSAIPRILHRRSGHSAPISQLQFLPLGADGADSGGKWLLSAARDRSLWGWSLRRDGQSSELSQGNVRKKARKMGILGSSLEPTESSTSLDELKASEIVCMASSLNRDGGMGAAAGGGKIWTNKGSQKEGANTSTSGLTGWESVITGHKGDQVARTWFWGRKKAGRWAFKTGDDGEVTSVAITPCGTFALIGSSKGGIDMFNLQSGLHRQRFPARLTPGQARKLKIQQLTNQEEPRVDTFNGARKFSPGEGKHTKAVTGLTIDALNRTVISCGFDGRVKFWDFATGILREELDWYPMTSITGTRYHQPSDLMALSCDDFSIRVLDVETKRFIREFWGCAVRINDYCFSHDGRWIVAASGDGAVRVWNLPTGHLIDAIRLESPCTALAFSGTGEFLATAHVEGVGVNIWNNRALFTHIPTRQISERDIAEIAIPTASGEGGQGILESAYEQEESGDSVHERAMTTVDQLDKGITTLSLVPRSRWQTLLHLDLIKQRNKPKEPPKAPEKAPFFLPSLENAKPPVPPSTQGSVEASAAERSRIMKMNRGSSESQFTSLLRAGAASADHTTFIAHLKSLSPATADVEIRSLNPLSSGSELISFVSALTTQLQAKLDYELVQAWMTVFLRVHGQVVAEDENLQRALTTWKDEQEKECKRLGALAGYCSGVVGFLRSTR
ncbi:MAG: hypothetical protein M1835_000703 [Candelina submexicana]|nr:MAG: hypothetical protein M1835_000703 [Candelina submexicana]